MKTNILFLLLCSSLIYFVLSPNAHAVSPAPDGVVPNPVPDGCYPNFTTAEGCNALHSLTTGEANTGLGWRSLFLNSSANFNTGVGAGALVLNTADSNTAVGAAALLLNTSGTENTAVGTAALLNNGTANRNNAVGYFALYSHTAGDFNNAVGAFALSADTMGVSNNAFGDGALSSNTTGTGNTGVGDGALAFNSSGTQNTAVGENALLHNTTGNSSIAVGFGAGVNVTTADDVICIGNDGQNVGNTTWIGNIYGVTTQSGTTAPVVVSDGGQLGTAPSSERFKKDIAIMGQASEAILSLRPVTFHYKTDGTSTPQFGLVAEEVEKVNPDLIIRDKEGKPYTVRYDAVNAMLLNEFLKERKAFMEEHRTVEELKKEVAALTAGLQKVSAQLELSKAAPQTVKNNQ